MPPKHASFNLETSVVCWQTPFTSHLVWYHSATGFFQKGGVRRVLFLVLGPANLIWSSLSSWLEKVNSLTLPLSLAHPLLVADRWSRYVCVLVWFHLGIFIFILISVLCSIPDCLANFWAHPWWRDVRLWEWGGCLHLVNQFVSFCLLVGKILAQSWYIYCVREIS
jgi:hypothetical protein